VPADRHEIKAMGQAVRLEVAGKLHHAIGRDQLRKRPRGKPERLHGVPGLLDGRLDDGRDAARIGHRGLIHWRARIPSVGDGPNIDHGTLRLRHVVTGRVLT
jgi:hypothetical protein